MEESLRIQIYDNLPLAEDFASRIEPRNVPAVFIGCVKDWTAFSKWNPSNGGLDYLQDRVGSSTVEAMLSRSAPVFYGDLRSHERVPLPFSSFIGFCKQHLQGKAAVPGVCLESPEKQRVAVCESEEGSLIYADAPQQIYLAQVPIMNVENEERVELETLREDIQTPAILGSRELSSINLWMNSAGAQSSTHYDPHNNLLCIVAGCKREVAVGICYNVCDPLEGLETVDIFEREGIVVHVSDALVVLWPPSASPLLYSRPIYGEASNHSSVALGNPDLSVHPRAERLMEHSQKVILHAGDALFIPEGWFHQVDSDDLTIAVNFWWQSTMMSSMEEHMDSYYLRRILRRLTDKEMNKVLLKSSSAGVGNMQKQRCELPNNQDEAYNGQELDHKCGSKHSEGKKLKRKTTIEELEPLALQALHKLVALVHYGVSAAEHSPADQSTSTNGSACLVKGEFNRSVASNLFRLEDDPVAKILWTLEPHTLQNVFLAMVNNFPRTLEALILHLLSPVGAEVLTRKFDEMDREANEEHRNQFYQAFYGAFDDQFAAMDAILNGKELFALQAFKNVLDQYLGVNFDGPKPVVG